MEPEPWGLGRSRRVGVGETSSLLLVPRGKGGGETEAWSGSRQGWGMAPAQEAAAGSPGLLGLTWIKGTLSIIAMGFQGEGKVGWSLPRAGRGLTFLPSFLSPQEGSPA